MVQRTTHTDSTPIEIRRDKNPTAAYAGKLTFSERCLAVALYAVGHRSKTIARFMSIHPNTLRFMVRSTSPHYREVRAEYARLGHDQFVDTYLSKERLDEYLKFAGGDKANTQAVDPDAPGYAPNPQSSGKSGRHVHTLSNGVTVTFAVYWNGTAWYYKEDSAEEIGPFGTSIEAYNNVYRFHDPAYWKKPPYILRREYEVARRVHMLEAEFERLRDIAYDVKDRYLSSGKDSRLLPEYDKAARAAIRARAEMLNEAVDAEAVVLDYDAPRKIVAD